MKTSITLPDVLHTTVQDLAPDSPFGELVRDALVMALPTWEAEKAQGQVVLDLNIKLRAARASAAQAGLVTVRQQRKPRAQTRPAAPPKPVPATPPARPRKAAPKSATRAAMKPDHVNPHSHRRAASPRS